MLYLCIMKEELTSKMHDEFTVTKEVEGKLRAGCVWRVWCGRNSSENEIRRCAESYGISYETAMRWRDFWLRMYKK